MTTNCCDMKNNKTHTRLLPAVSVILFTGGGLPQCMPGTGSPWEQAPPQSRPPGSRHPPGAGTPSPGHTVKRPVRILLECILFEMTIACLTQAIRRVPGKIDLFKNGVVDTSKRNDLQLCGYCSATEQGLLSNNCHLGSGNYIAYLATNNSFCKLLEDCDLLLVMLLKTVVRIRFDMPILALQYYLDLGRFPCMKYCYGEMTT